MGNGCETKRKNRAKILESFWDTIKTACSTNLRLRCELKATEALLAERTRELRAKEKAA